MNDRNVSNEDKLNQIYEMTLENHEILKTIRRQQYFSNAVRLLYWLVILGALGGAYYYIRPFIAVLTENSGKIEETMVQLNLLKNQLPEAKLLNQLIEGFQKTTP